MRTRTLAVPTFPVSALAAVAAFAAVAAVGVLSPSPAVAADQGVVAKNPANEQVVVPEVDRRDIKMPRFPSNDFEIGVYTGTYATQNFGSSVVAGLRAGYH